MSPLSFLLLIGLALRLYHLQAPIIGFHAWRQADTAAIARNFYTSGYHFLWPQIDWGGDTAGYCETEFPIYPFLVALLYQWGGVIEAYGRLVSALCGVVTIYFLYALLQRYGHQSLAFWGCCFYTILPLNIYYSRTFQPESMMLMASVLAIERFDGWLRSAKLFDLACSALWMSLACLLKVLPIVYIGIPLFYLAWQRFQGQIWRRIDLWGYALVVIGSTALWYLHAHQIYLQTQLSFGFWGHNSDRYDWALLWSSSFWGEILLRLGVRNFAIVAFPIFIWGLCRLPARPGEGLFRVWLAASAFSWLLAPVSSMIHEYYQLPLMLPAAFFIGKVYETNWPKRRYLSYGLVLTIISSLAFYTIDYVRHEDPIASPSHAPIYALAQQVRQQTRSGDRLVTLTGGDPTLLYLADRKGWILSLPQLNPTVLESTRDRGAKYIVGTCRGFAQVDDCPQAKALLSRTHQSILNTEDAFIFATAPIP